MRADFLKSIYLTAIFQHNGHQSFIWQHFTIYYIELLYYLITTQIRIIGCNLFFSVGHFKKILIKGIKSPVR